MTPKKIITNSKKSITSAKKEITHSIVSNSRKFSDKKHIGKSWNNNKNIANIYLHRDNYVRKKWVSDGDYYRIVDAYKKMNKSGISYSEYKKEFDKVMKFFGLPTKDIMIVKHNEIKGKEKNDNTLEMKYVMSKRKITIPRDMTLYHTTPVDVKELKPYFKGKKNMGYLYDSPRIYLTGKKNLSKNSLDMTKKKNFDTSKPLHKYTPKEVIRQAHIDPLIPNADAKSIYVATHYPMPVTKLEGGNDTMAITFKDELDDLYIESQVDLYIESIRGKIGAWKREKEGAKEFDKIWAKSNSNIKKFKNIWKSMSPREYKDWKSKYNILRTTENYGRYKRVYNDMKKIFGITDKNTVIRRFKTEKNNKGGYDVKCEVSIGARKIIIPNGTRLTHVSPAAGITELKPTYRSKNGDSFFYPTKRVYFTLQKDVDVHSAGLHGMQQNKYTPVEDIKTAYIDPCAGDRKFGYIYVETDYPIRIKPIQDVVKKSKMPWKNVEKKPIQKPSEKKDNNKASVKKESVNDDHIADIIIERVQDSFQNGNITTEEYNYFINTLLENK